MSRSRGSTAAAASSSGSTPPAASSASAGPGRHSPVGAAVQQPVHLQAHREPVRGGARQAGALAQLGQPARLGGRRPQHPHGFVEHADAAMLSHKQILTSYDSEMSRGAAVGTHAGREGVGRSTWCARVRDGSPTCSTSTSTSCTRSPARRRSTASASPGGRCAGPTSRRHRGPQRPHARRPRADRRPGLAHPGRDAARNCAEFGVPLYPMDDAEQGIVHVVGPQLGLTQPGMTVVCGDSHTSTHGAFGAMAFGIGTSEVEHVLATQTLPLKPFKTMAINVNVEDGRLRPGRHEQGRRSSRSSPRSAPAAARATCWSTAATSSRTSRWRPG